MTHDDDGAVKILKNLFDLQKFKSDKRLKKLTEKVGAQYGLCAGRRELADDEIEVWAAGDPSSGTGEKDPFGEEDEDR